MAAFDACVVCNQREADLVNDDTLPRRLHVIETGASLDFDTDRAGGDAATATALPAEPVVGFLGAMDYPPNVDSIRWFTRRIWPRIVQRSPQAQWWIVGRSPTRAVRELDNGRNIHVTGTVPDVEPYLRRMRVSVAPLRLARGVRTKVLTAMAAARPCVVTSCVAEGIEAEPGREILIADDESSFTRTVVDLLEDPARAETVGRAGRDFVARRYRPAQALARIEQLLCGHQPVEVNP